MSENKDFEEKAEDAFDDVKNEAKDLGDKAKKAFEETAEEAKDLGGKAKKAFEEAAEDVKEEAKDLGGKAKKAFEEAKEEAKDFADDVKQSANTAFGTDNPESAKNIAIISHLTIIGWVIAFIMHNQNKTEFGSFYLRQTLGIFLLGLVLSFVPIFGWILCLILLIISFISALNNKKEPVLLVGSLFQDWFTFL